MEDMEARVWQRVLAQPQKTQVEDLKPLILVAQELTAVYGRLVREMTGRSRELLRRLQETELANIACLKGISALQGRGVRLNSIQVAREPAEKALEKCYHRTRRATTEYMARSAGAEFGEVYRALADREREQCVRLAEVLGNLI